MINAQLLSGIGAKMVEKNRIHIISLTRPPKNGHI